MNLQNLTPGQVAALAALATVAAAAVSAAAGLTIALVNGWTGRRLAESNARRERRVKLLTPLMDDLEKEYVLVIELFEAYTKGDTQKYSELRDVFVGRIGPASSQIRDYRVLGLAGTLASKRSKYTLASARLIGRMSVEIEELAASEEERVSRVLPAWGKFLRSVDGLYRAADKWMFRA